MYKFMLLLLVAFTLPARADSPLAYDANEFITEVAGTYTVPVGGARHYGLKESDENAQATSERIKRYEGTTIVLFGNRIEEFGPTSVNVVLNSGTHFEQREFYSFYREKSETNGRLVTDSWWRQYVAQKTITESSVSFPPYAIGAVLHSVTWHSHRDGISKPWSKPVLEEELRLQNNGNGMLEMTYVNQLERVILKLVKNQPGAQ